MTGWSPALSFWFIAVFVAKILSFVYNDGSYLSNKKVSQRVEVLGIVLFVLALVTYKTNNL